MRKSALSFLVLSLAALGGCATAAPGPVEVTRFHRPEVATLSRGSIAIEAAPGTDPQGFDFRYYAGAISAELARLGYAPAGQGPLVAVVDVHHGFDRAGSTRGPVSVGVGGSTGGWSSGVGLGLGINLGGGPKEQVHTELAVSIRDRSTNQAVWEGRARYSAPAKSPLADPQQSAAKMAQALFQGFPGQSGETILVK